MRTVSLRRGVTSIPAATAHEASAAATGAHTESIHGLASERASFDAALRLTAIALLLRPMGPWFVRPVILALAVLVLVFPRALRHPLVWGAAALSIAIRILEDWPLADNHIYLLCYWALGIALAVRAADPPRALASTSRWLVGLAFAFAVLWKAFLSPDFLDGRFFRVTLLTDPRFGAAVQLIGGLSADQLDANRKALAVLPGGAELLEPPVVEEPAALRALATASTWGILGLEAAVALLMFLPAAPAVSFLRPATLLVFCGVTYAFAPVAGFGWLLLAMGLAQIEARHVWLARAYVVAFLVVIFYGEIPWADLTLDLLR
jgi:hypothetical protein